MGEDGPSIRVNLMQLRQAPTVGARRWKRRPKRDTALVGPITPEGIITNWKQQIKYPCYRIKDTQSLKDK